jgi:hypothetical protein
LARYRPLLEHVLADTAAPERHRYLAFRSLLNYGPDGIEAVVRTYVATISGERESISLRSSIVGGLYGRPFGPPDAVAILNDVNTESDSRVVGELWPLALGIPVHHLTEVLEAYERDLPHPGTSSARTPNFEVSACVERMVGRLYEEMPEDDANLVDRLLKVLRGIDKKGLDIPGGSVHLDRILSKRPRLLRTLIDSAVRHIHEFEFPAIVGFTLSQLTRGAATPGMVAERLSAEFDSRGEGVPFSPDLLLKYDALGRCLCSSGPAMAGVFERFIEIGRSHPECAALLEAYTRPEIDQNEPRPSPFAAGVAEYRAHLLRRVESGALALQRGETPALQGELAKLYFGFYSGEGQYVRRRQLLLALGAPLTEAVERGFVAMVEGQAPPRLADIADVSAASKYYPHWYAVSLG